jgi:hypothetical protein
MCGGSKIIIKKEEIWGDCMLQIGERKSGNHA